MRTASPEQAARQTYRLAQRDAGSHTDARPGTGERSTVSPQRLTIVAHGAAAAAGAARGAGPATSGPAVSGALAETLRVASTPPGQARNDGGTGARPQTGSSGRTTGKEGHTL